VRVSISPSGSLSSTGLIEGGGCSLSSNMVGVGGLLGTRGNPRSAGSAQRRRRLWAPFFLLGGVAEVPCLHPDLPPGRKPKIPRIGRRRRAARRVLVGGVAWGVWCSVRRVEGGSFDMCSCFRWLSCLSQVLQGRQWFGGCGVFPSFGGRGLGLSRGSSPTPLQLSGELISCPMVRRLRAKARG
jgi:hypothetical protein